MTWFSFLWRNKRQSSEVVTDDYDDEDEALDEVESEPPVALPEPWLAMLKALDAKDDEISELASHRRGGAYTSGLCNVGSDMQSGLSEARSGVRIYQYQRELSVEQNMRNLAESLFALKTQSFYDSEGYVAGTIHDMACVPLRWAETIEKEAVSQKIPEDNSNDC